VLEPSRLFRGAEIPRPGPGGFEEREARQPLGTGCRERERGRTSARVPDELKAVPAAAVGFAQDARYLELEAVVLRRVRLCVDLEILRGRLDVGAERGDEVAVRELGREHDPGKEDHANGHWLYAGGAM